MYDVWDEYMDGKKAEGKVIGNVDMEKNGWIKMKDKGKKWRSNTEDSWWKDGSSEDDKKSKMNWIGWEERCCLCYVENDLEGKVKEMRKIGSRRY